MEEAETTAWPWEISEEFPRCGGYNETPLQRLANTPFESFCLLTVEELQNSSLSEEGWKALIERRYTLEALQGAFPDVPWNHARWRQVVTATKDVCYPSGSSRSRVPDLLAARRWETFVRESGIVFDGGTPSMKLVEGGVEISAKGRAGGYQAYRQNTRAHPCHPRVPSYTKAGRGVLPLPAFFLT